MINNKAGNNILQELVARHPGLIHTDTRVSDNLYLQSFAFFFTITHNFNHY